MYVEIRDTYAMVNNTKLVNLTAHSITIFAEPSHYEKITVPPSGIVARCKEEQETYSMLGNIPIWKRTFGEVEDLPEPVDGTVYIVSKIVANACPNRNDLYIPGVMLRTADGTPEGCYGLSVL